jgi:hypothetical protein
MTTMLVAAVTAALVIGFLAGLLTFKRKQLWCPEHGETMRCPSCAEENAPMRSHGHGRVV